MPVNKLSLASEPSTFPPEHWSHCCKYFHEINLWRLWRFCHWFYIRAMSALVLSNPPEFNFEMTDSEDKLNYFYIKWYDWIVVQRNMRKGTGHDLHTVGVSTCISLSNLIHRLALGTPFSSDSILKKTNNIWEFVAFEINSNHFQNILLIDFWKWI